MKSIPIILFTLFFAVMLDGKETPVVTIPLAGDITDPRKEISGLDWYRDELILLPQYPKGEVYSIPRSQIHAYLNKGMRGPIRPGTYTFQAPDFEKHIPGFEGFEAIVFYQDTVYLTLEAKYQGMMTGWLVKGNVDPKKRIIQVMDSLLTKITPPANINNMAFETLIMHQNRIVVMFEANGAAVNSRPLALVFSSLLEPTQPLEFPAIEYRITDATKVRDDGVFWAINYFWPGDRKYLKPGKDPITLRYGKGKTHSRAETVERLIAFQVNEKDIQTVDRAPVELELLIGNDSRNWEGLVFFDDAGFLVVTDEHPGTILGFVPFKE